MVGILVEQASVRKDLYFRRGCAREERNSLNRSLDPFRNGKGLKHLLAADQKQRKSVQLLKLKTASSSCSLLPQKRGINHTGISTPH